MGNWHLLATRLSTARQRWVIAAVIVIIVAAVFCVFRLQQLHLADTMRREAVNLSIQSELATIRAFTRQYSHNVIRPAVAAGVSLTHDPSSNQDAIPFPISLAKDVSDAFADGEHQPSFRIYSDWPWTFRQGGGPQSPFEADALHAFQQGRREPILAYKSSPDGETVLRAEPLIMEESCIGCHRDLPASPKRDWKVGDVRGVISVAAQLPPAPSFFSWQGVHWSMLGFFAGLGFIIATVITLLFRTVRARDILQQQRLAAERDAVMLQSRAKTEFLASMSHELRTPLNAIIGFSDMMSGRVGRLALEKQSEYAEDINKSGRHLLALVNDLLDLEKIEHGKVELTESYAELVALVRERASMIARSAVARGITISFDSEPPSVLARVDERFIRQILDNLLSNAVKFSADESEIRVSLSSGHGGSVIIAVEDEGIGVDEETQATLFDPYTQADASISRKFGGTGLGLSIAKAQVEMHGGEIWIDSVLGEGTIVSFSIPAKRVVFEASEHLDGASALG